MNRITITRAMMAGCLLVVLIFPLSAAGFDYSGMDLGGKTISLLTWYDPADDPNIYDAMAEAEEIFNCTIETVIYDWAEANQVCMSRLLAGESAYDIWFMSHPFGLRLASQRAVYRMNEVLPPGYYENHIPELAAKVEHLKYHDNIYAFNTLHSALNDMLFILWNKTLFEREGFPDLYELYEAGEWTWEAASEIAVTATRDTNGDGVIDQFGFGDLFPMAWVLANNGTVVRRDEDGRYVYSLHEAPAISALGQLYNWIHVSQVSVGDWNQTGFREGTHAFANVPAWMLWDLPDEMEDEYGILPFPKGPHNDDYANPTDLLNMIYLPANAAEPETMAALVDCIAPSVDDYYERVIENQIVNQAPDRMSAEIMERTINNWDGQFNLVRDNAGQSLVDEAVNAVVYGDKSPMVAMMEIRPQVQAAIDELFRQ